MKSGDAGEILSGEIRRPDSQPGFRGAGIVNFNRSLRVFRIAADSEADIFRGGSQRAETLPLRKRIEDDVVAPAQQFPEVLFGICGGESGNFLAEFLAAEPGFIRRTGAGSVQHFRQQRINRIHGKCFLRQQDLDSGPFPHGVKHCQISAQKCLVHDETRRFDLIQRQSGHLNSSTQGSPYWLSFSMNGAGSNCSMLYTPAPFHTPVAISMAPIMAGTPVV